MAAGLDKRALWATVAALKSFLSGADELPRAEDEEEPPEERTHLQKKRADECNTSCHPDYTTVVLLLYIPCRV